MKKKESSLALAILLFFVGVVAGKLMDFPIFKLDKSISIIDALSLIATVFVAIYVARKIESDLLRSQNECSFYVAEIENIEKRVNRLNDYINTDQIIYYQSIVGSVHQVRLKKNSLFRYLAKHSAELDERNNPVMQRITSVQKSLKSLLTDTSRSGVDATEGIVHYSKEVMSDISSTICILQDLLFELKLEVNNS